MALKIVSLLLIVALSGCASTKQDFDESLIPIPDKKAKQREEVWIEAKTSRVWVNDRVDENGDLVEGHYKNVILEPGHWDVKGSDNGQQRK